MAADRDHDQPQPHPIHLNRLAATAPLNGKHIPRTTRMVAIPQNVDEAIGNLARANGISHNQALVELLVHALIDLQRQAAAAADAEADKPDPYEGGDL